MRLQRVGQRSKAAYVVLISKSVRGFGKIGFTVAKNVGPAHLRNLIKRRLRHIAREQAWMFEKCDLIILALPSAAKASFQELQKDVERAYAGLRSSRRP